MKNSRRRKNSLEKPYGQNSSKIATTELNSAICVTSNKIREILSASLNGKKVNKGVDKQVA
jgi:hypothetical protein